LLTIPAVFIDTLIFMVGWLLIATFYIAKFVISHLFISINNKLIQPILHLIAIAAGITLLYIIYTTGLWHAAVKLAEQYISTF